MSPYVQSRPHARRLGSLAAAIAALALSTAASAAPMQVTVNVENLAAANGVAVTPLNVGFHSGTFDAFDLGGAAGPAIQRIAEFGDGSMWQAAFIAADPGASVGTVGGAPALPGGMASSTFSVDTAANRYFTFAAMVLPSNDFFIGNDSPTAYQLFDASGNLQLASITVRARDIWDAGTEVFDPAATAFIGDAALHVDQNSVVARNFAELAALDGLMTGAGYAFHSGLTADSDVYRISFAVAAVPEPATTALMLAGLAGVGFVARRRRAGQAGSNHA